MYNRFFYKICKFSSAIEPNADSESAKFFMPSKPGIVVVQIESWGIEKVSTISNLQ